MLNSTVSICQQLDDGCSKILEPLGQIAHNQADFDIPFCPPSCEGGIFQEVPFLSKRVSMENNYFLYP